MPMVEALLTMSAGNSTFGDGGTWEKMGIIYR